MITNYDRLLRVLEANAANARGPALIERLRAAIHEIQKSARDKRGKRDPINRAREAPTALRNHQQGIRSGSHRRGCD
jgi:hypothetical protein